jgi:uncharacterized phosphosugar-binding protein
MSKLQNPVNLDSYSSVALPHLEKVLKKNQDVLKRIQERLVGDVRARKSLFVFGSGHSALLPLEVYHRAGGASFVIPLVADFLLPSAGPPVVRLMERTAGSATFLLNRAQPRPGEMLWLASQSGINSTVVDMALEAKRRNLFTVAFTSVTHSQAVPSRHSSNQKLYEICDEVVDWGGFVGDAAVSVNSDVSVGPLSSLTGIFLAHSVLSATMSQLENEGVRCAYTSVNTPEGEKRNLELEEVAKVRDPLLR